MCDSNTIIIHGYGDVIGNRSKVELEIVGEDNDFIYTSTSFVNFIQPVSAFEKRNNKIVWSKWTGRRKSPASYENEYNFFHIPYDLVKEL